MELIWAFALCAGEGHFLIATFTAIMYHYTNDIIAFEYGLANEKCLPTALLQCDLHNLKNSSSSQD